MTLNHNQQQQLLQLATTSIQQGLSLGHFSMPDLANIDPALNILGASFVTLNNNGELRGCIGSIQAHQPLAHDVACHAYDAAFRDPRFTPIEQDELANLAIHISVLTPPQNLPRGISEQQLIGLLTPTVDGLILQQGHRHAVFLPQVWEKLTEPRQFIHQLKRKGGWPTTTPIEALEVSVFQVQEFGH